MALLAKSERYTFERLEDRCMLAFTAPDILFADDVGHLVTADQISEAGYRNIMTQSDGKVVVAGSAKGPDGSDDFYLARYLANGTSGFVLDTSFGNNGVVLTNFASGGRPNTRDDYLRGAAIDSQDRIVAVGESRGTDIIARYTPDGQLDTTFSGDGYDSPGDLINETEGNDWRVAFDNDAPVVAAITRDGSLSYAIFRYDATGSFDSQLGLVTTVVRDGVIGSRYGRHRVTDIAVYPDTIPEHAGKIVLTGSTVGDVFDPAVGQDITRRDSTVVRFNTDGSLDATFGGDGIAFQRVYDPTANPWVWADGSTADTSIAQGVLVEDDGQIVVSGYTAEGMTITRYNVDGSYDSSFNSSGIQPGRFGFNIPALGHIDHSDLVAGELATSIAKDLEGNYVVGGFWIYRGGDADGDGNLDDYSGTLDRFAFARVHPDGSLDTTFGDNGTYLEYLGAGGNRMSGLVVNNIGEIWAAGYDADRKSILLRFAEESDNQSPVAVNDAYATDEDTLLSVDAPGVLVNDSDGDGDPLTVFSADSSSAYGATVTVNSDGSLTYDPRSAADLQNLAEGEILQDSFAYTISDAKGGLATATVAVTVSGLDEAEPPSSDPALFVYDIRFESRRRDRDFRAVFEIRSDSDGDGLGTANDAVATGVSVTVTFAGQSYTGVTDSDGIFRTDWVRNLGSGDYYANVIDLALADYLWNPLALDLEDDSDGDGLPDDLLTV